MNEVPVIYSFARSGGTLVNQLLGVHPQCLVLSEINPAASYMTATEQSVKWLGLVSEAEQELFSNLPYHRQIKILYDRASNTGKRLIVRDWVTVNFMPYCIGNEITPSGQLEQEIYLRRAGLNPVPLVISRRGGEVLDSIKVNFPHLQNLNLEVIARAYFDYAKAVSALPVVHLEDLRSKPDAVVLWILQRFDLHTHVASDLIKTFPQFINCTGNNSLGIMSESSMAKTILPNKLCDSKERFSARVNALLQQSDSIFGYE